MKVLSLLVRAAICVALTLIAFTAVAADYPTPQEGDWVARDFRFHTGEVMQELHLHYTTVGAPSGQPALILHGTTQSGTAMLSPVFAGELFGPGRRWMQASTTSSCPTASAMANLPNLPESAYES